MTKNREVLEFCNSFFRYETVTWFVDTHRHLDCQETCIVHLWPCVHHIHELAGWIGLHNGLHHLLILCGACTEARQWLTTATNGGLNKTKGSSPH